MKFALVPWLKRALVKYEPPGDLTVVDEMNGWTPEGLAAYHAESHARAMSIVAASMDARRRPPRSRWANSRYDPLHWRG